MHRTEQDRQEVRKTLICLHFNDGAPGRTRTNTSVRKPDFESTDGYCNHLNFLHISGPFG